VNHVGVELNTASAPLLSYVAGIGPSAREEDREAPRRERALRRRKRGCSTCRASGRDAFEQCAGFLRVRTAPSTRSTRARCTRSATRSSSAWPPTSASSVASSWATAQGRRAIQIGKYVSEEVGEPTLKDILAELEKPGRDPRAASSRRSSATT
jgi:uncharacterized protein